MEQFMIIRKWERATTMFIQGVQNWWLPEFVFDMQKKSKKYTQCKLLTFDDNPQLHHVDDKLEAVTEDEDTNNTDENSGNHKVSALNPA